MNQDDGCARRRQPLTLGKPDRAERQQSPADRSRSLSATPPPERCAAQSPPRAWAGPWLPARCRAPLPRLDIARDGGTGHEPAIAHRERLRAFSRPLRTRSSSALPVVLMQRYFEAGLQAGMPVNQFFVNTELSSPATLAVGPNRRHSVRPRLARLDEGATGDRGAGHPRALLLDPADRLLDQPVHIHRFPHDRHRRGRVRDSRLPDGVFFFFFFFFFFFWGWGGGWG